MEFELGPYDDPPKPKRKHPRFRRRISHANKVWHHKDRQAIELKLASGISCGVLEKEYGIAANILRYYRQHNLTQSFKDKVRKAMSVDGRVPENYDTAFRDEKDLESHLAEIIHQKATLLDAQSQALKTGNLNLIAPLATAVGKLLEQEARLRGFLTSAATQVMIENNLNQTTEPKEQDLSSLSIEELETLMALSIKIEAANKPRMIEHVR